MLSTRPAMAAQIVIALPALQLSGLTIATPLSTFRNENTSRSIFSKRSHPTIKKMRQNMKTMSVSICLLIAARSRAPPRSPLRQAMSQTSSLKPFRTWTRRSLTLSFAQRRPADDILLPTISSFHHDTGGLTGYQQSTDNFRKLFANVPRYSSLTSRQGRSRFTRSKTTARSSSVCIALPTQTNGKKETGSFKFLHVWRKAGDSWKIARVISYGH